MLLFLNPFNFDFTTIDWKVIIGVVAVLVTGFGLFYFQWWRNRKRLSYEILSDVLLISAKKEIDDKVEIRYEGRPVKNVRLLVIKLINDGYQPIKRDDFERPIKFHFETGTILSAEIVKFQPENLNTGIERFGNFVEIESVLFNKKDYIQIKILISDFEDMDIDARIVGVSSIGKVRQFSVFFQLALLPLTFTFLFLASKATEILLGIIYMLLAVALTAVMFVTMFFPGLRRR